MEHFVPPVMETIIKEMTFISVDNFILFLNIINSMFVSLVSSADIMVNYYAYLRRVFNGNVKDIGQHRSNAN